MPGAAPEIGSASVKLHAYLPAGLGGVGGAGGGGVGFLQSSSHSVLLVMPPGLETHCFVDLSHSQPAAHWSVEYEPRQSNVAYRSTQWAETAPIVTFFEHQPHVGPNGAVPFVPRHDSQSGASGHVTANAAPRLRSERASFSILDRSARKRALVMRRCRWRCKIG